jgi:hypothetical protein
MRLAPSSRASDTKPNDPAAPPAPPAPPPAKDPPPAKAPRKVTLRIAVNGMPVRDLPAEVVGEAAGKDVEKGSLELRWTHPMSRLPMRGIYPPVKPGSPQGWIR